MFCLAAITFSSRPNRGLAVRAFGYFEDEPGRRSAANLLTKDEARRMGLELRQAAGAAAQAIDR